MYIGIDLGTSGVKVILLNEQGEVVASQTEKPRPFRARIHSGRNKTRNSGGRQLIRAMKALGDQHCLQDVKALGIAGQMHGATLLDSTLRVLRPAIFVERRALCARGALCWKTKVQRNHE
ncbi:hypothetical protein MJ391_27100 [Escherichia coli]|nr:hypothetical protein MJ391_27100 [Escherichia coli]